MTKNCQNFIVVQIATFGAVVIGGSDDWQKKIVGHREAWSCIQRGSFLLGAGLNY